MSEKSYCGLLQKDNELDIKNIRNRVFTDEQNVDPEIDFDGQDPKAVQAIIYCDNKAVATGRMLEDGHIGRVAVLKEYRSLGFGSKIIEILQNHAIKNNYPRIYLGAQLHAESFYKKLGFERFGQEYIEANIKHIAMQRGLT